MTNKSEIFKNDCDTKLEYYPKNKRDDSDNNRVDYDKKKLK